MFVITRIRGSIQDLIRKIKCEDGIEAARCRFTVCKKAGSEAVKPNTGSKFSRSINFSCFLPFMFRAL